MPDDRNRARYDAVLKEVETEIVRMGGIVMEMIHLAVQAAVADDHEFANQVVPMDDEVDRLELSLSQKVIMTIFRESPVAHDFLFLTSTLGIISEVEQAGDDAAKLARRAGKLQVAFPDELKELLIEMGRQTRANLSAALRLTCEYSKEEADRLIASDDQVNASYKTSRRAVLDLMRTHPDDLRQLLRCAEIFHALEHVSDHTVDIAKRLKIFYEQSP